MVLLLLLFEGSSLKFKDIVIIYYKIGSYVLSVSMYVWRIMYTKGTIKLNMSQMSIILIYEVAGRL